MSTTNPLYQKFITNLEKKGFFNDCTQPQREIKMKTAQQYFDLHYSKQCHFVGMKPKEQNVDIQKKADEHKLKGNEYLNAKDYSKAIDEYTKAIQLNQEAVYYSNRSAAYCSIDENDLAIEDAKKAIELDPNYAKAYARLGIALTKKHKYAEAQKAIEDALIIDPNNTVFKSNLEQIKCLILNQQPPASSSIQQQEKKEEQPNEENIPKTTEEKKDSHEIHSNEQAQSQNTRNEEPNPQQPNPLANILSNLVGSTQGGQGINPGAVDINSLMGTFGSQNGIASMALSLLNNPATRPMVSLIAQMIGMPVEDLQRHLSEEAQNENSNQNTSQQHQTPPGFV
ncbi:small glutamine-rich tetratricopeptide repeat-containing protein, putative [Entamoeba dispar SAW760]|uniref:Small glutamine-rich tetratricopeptide repeat-containing protein, putative n=1 Tax=Entamoeba dispar (strain ATCC PRA-260 / SAW760) TaxID=370354 RepID=B0EAL1_ENTDS|nr:small glutamine-rich tetratricopeptide repeat-containing protein, putative [Entamoeba dispar SAW760]EDR28434.1 small glutamine-rich tetratricopeptide repeat-containing protein, putative [Entamoeba dispar SAW760]|eukprot:EDR28434.1 small glutamine-rich tetratricopeptide repeat-containing protein, putative [Entamoeba dispar SAW760]